VGPRVVLCMEKENMSPCLSFTKEKIRNVTGLEYYLAVIFLCKSEVLMTKRFYKRRGECK
jgi:hypothetical protein